MEKKLSILDFISLSVLEVIFDNYSDGYPGICLAINDLDENIIIARNFHPICLSYNRKNVETEKICVECNKHITNYLKDHDYIEYKCGNGIVDIAFPLMNNNERIGTFYIGQIFIEGDETEMSFFETHAQKYGIDTKEYMKEAKTIKILTREEISNLVANIKSDIIDLITI